MDAFHKPVLLEEVLRFIQPKPGDVLVDGTMGGGGHTEKMLEAVGDTGTVIGIDLDPLAIDTATRATAAYSDNLIIVRDNFKNIKNIVQKALGDKKLVDGILLDLGLSSGQLSDSDRGFSFSSDATLDMRFGGQTDLTAELIVNSYSENQLTDIFRTYGEEELARPIARRIVELRAEDPIVSSQQLTRIAEEQYRKKYRVPSKKNPATKIFQALRIEVNQELENLKTALPDTLSILKKGGRLVIISYHSLEDKIVKDFFKTESRDCICPPELPVCRCNHVRKIRLLTRKPLVATAAEVASNPRSRSAKLRAVEKT